MIKSDEKNQGNRNIEIFQHISKGNDGNIRSVKLRCKKAILERAIQHLYPMELACSSYKAPKKVVLDPNALVLLNEMKQLLIMNE